MSNTAQTVTTIGALIALIGIVVGIQTFWIARSLDKLEAAIGKLDGKIDGVDARLGTGLARVDAKLDELKTEIVRDHGERIAKLEERIIRHP